MNILTCYPFHSRNPKDESDQVNLQVAFVEASHLEFDPEILRARRPSVGGKVMGAIRVEISFSMISATPSTSRVSSFRDDMLNKSGESSVEADR